MAELIKDFPQWFKVIIVLIPIISLLIAACALVLNFNQTRLTNKISRTKMVSDTLHTFMDDKTIQNAFYKVEYGQFKYTTNFHGSEDEKEIDKMLRHYSNLALMWKNGLITMRDIYPIQYYIIRITQDKEVQKYLNFIEKWSKNSRVSSHPFLALNELGEEIKRASNKKAPII